MNNINKFLILAVLTFALTTSLSAEKYKGEIRRNTTVNTKAAACLPATNSNELTINNVRAYLETNGTMWFKEIAQYEIPKGSEKHPCLLLHYGLGGWMLTNSLN
jgi:hypothetical protein